jgi:hypothetical protein
LSDDKTPNKKPLVRVFEDRLKPAEFARTEHLLTAPQGASADDYLDPETYAHVLNKLRPDDVITVIAEDRTWRCEVLVLAINGQRIDLAPLSKHEFGALEGKEHDLYEAEYAGKSVKWRVMRKSDRHVMVDKLGSKSEAVEWIERNADLKQAA